MKTGRYVLYAGVIAAVLVVALIASFQLRDRNPVAASPSPSASASSPIPASSVPSVPSPVATPSTAPTAVSTGAITGRFGYPSDFIPPVTVYAISTKDQRVWFSVDYPGAGNPPRPTPQPGTSAETYTITGVAPGTYWVVAYRNDGALPDPGYYSRASECAHTTPSGPCPDASLIPVTVISGQTTSAIDVISWGTPSSGPPSPTFPPRPSAR